MKHPVARFIVAALVAICVATPAAFTAANLPARLTDAEFWALSRDLSEPDGYFRGDNLLSNELDFAAVVPELVSRTKPGGVYLGVGPEQNFTYIAAMQPRMAFIVDIRRDNLLLHLMYKALFELAADRAEFVSLLFTKPRPDGLGATTSAAGLMNAYWQVATSGLSVYKKNVEAIRNGLVDRHGFPLSTDDLRIIESAYQMFYWYGPRIDHLASTGQRPGYLSFAELMKQTSPAGEELAFLGSEDKFRLVKDLHTRNLIVPVVGNFAGPKAIRAVGSYLRGHNATVSAFYVSNVEFHLKGDRPAFCANVATLPLDEASVFVRPDVSVGVTLMVNAAIAESHPNMALPTPVRPATKPVVPVAEDLKSCAGRQDAALAWRSR